MALGRQPIYLVDPPPKKYIYTAKKEDFKFLKMAKLNMIVFCFVFCFYFFIFFIFFVFIFFCFCFCFFFVLSWLFDILIKSLQVWARVVCFCAFLMVPSQPVLLPPLGLYPWNFSFYPIINFANLHLAKTDTKMRIMGN